ncbi:MAG: ATP-binding protein [Gemmatimonadetes bacterium]|nr:ATP-binding protein [Gemmatimonadota bacterium]
MAPGPHRVVLTGSESTGKTSLARALAAHFGWPWVAEYARRFAEGLGRPIAAADVERIAVGQRQAEDSALGERPPGLVLDTDLISTCVYAHHYFGSAPGWLEQAVTVRAGGLYLLCDIDLPWVPDPVRDRGAQRSVLHQSFRDELARRAVRFETVAGHGRARLTAAIEVVERWVQAGDRR